MSASQPRMTTPSRMRLVLAVFLSLVLVLSGVPMPAAASSETVDDSATTTDASSATSDASISESDSAADSTSDSDSDKASQISELLAEGDYVEGEVVAAVYGDAASTTDWFADEGDSADAETLLDTTASTYATATDEAVSAQSTDDAVSVILITNPDMTCEQMLDALWDDSRILMVEPNYVEQVEDDTADEVDTASVDDATELAAQDAVTSSSSTSSDDATAQATSVPDLTSYQWGLDNDGSTFNDGKSYLGFDIDSPNWPDGDENAAGVVAVMDSGIDYTNPDLDDVMVDDMRSYNLDGGDYGMNVSGIGDATDVMDTLGHGTHCAGIIASEWNGFGTSGVANGVKLTAVKVYNADGALTTASMARGYAYLSKCVDNGLNLVAVNNSWGDRQITKMTSLIVTQLGEKGVVSIFSAGNEADDTDYNPRPASALKDNPYAVVVGATSKNGVDAYNFGQSTTDVMAPGTQILSTAILKGTSVLGQASYLSEADGTSTVHDSFDTTTGAVKAYKTFDETTLAATDQIGTTSSTYYYESGSSLKLTADDLADFGTAYGSQQNGCYLKVPLGSATMANLKMLAVCDAASSYTARTLELATIQSDGSLGWASSITAATWSDTILSDRAWRGGSFDLSSVGTTGSHIALDTDGCATFRISFAPAVSEAYLDCFAAGTTVAPYCYMSGTSMAAPMVSGAAAVAALDQGLTSQAPSSMRGQLARDRVSWLKSHINQYDGRFLTACTSGGQIDLSTSSAKVLPVIDSAELVDGSDPLQVRISGSSFGSSGTVSVAGTAATVVSWSDGEIVAEVPEGTTAGVLPITVTTGAGSCTESYLLEVPSASNKALFEKDIEMPAELSQNSMDNLMVGLDDCLYVLPQDQYEAYYQSDHDESYEIGSYREMWRYDPSDESWTACAALPEQVNTLSATAHDGHIVACGTVIDWTAKTARSVLYSYDPAADAWQALDASQVPLASSIADMGGQLVLVGGASGVGASVFGPTSLLALDKDNIATLDISDGTVTPVGSLASGCVCPKVAADGTSIYVCQGRSISSSSVTTIDGMQKVTRSGDGWSTEDISSALPRVTKAAESDRSKTIHGTYGIAMTSTGPIISGVLAYTDDTETTFVDADTYLSSDGGATFSDFGKRAWRAPLFYASAATSGGWLYVMGSTALDDDVLVLRATRIEPEPTSPETPTTPETPATTGDTTQASTPTAQAVPRTADDSLPVLPVVLVGCVLAGLALALRRRNA